MTAEGRNGGSGHRRARGASAKLTDWSGLTGWSGMVFRGSPPVLPCVVIVERPGGGEGMRPGPCQKSPEQITTSHKGNGPYSVNANGTGKARGKTRQGRAEERGRARAGPKTMGQGARMTDICRREIVTHTYQGAGRRSSRCPARQGEGTGTAPGPAGRRAMAGTEVQDRGRSRERGEGLESRTGPVRPGEERTGPGGISRGRRCRGSRVVRSRGQGCLPRQRE